MIRDREDKPRLAVIIILLVYLCFACIDISAKWMVQAGIPVGEVVFVRYVGHLVLVVALFLPSQGSALWRMNRPSLTLVRGFMLLCGTASNFIALQYLPLTVTTSIFFVSPLLVTALSALVLRESVGPRRWAAIVLGLVGVLVITRPWGAEFHWAMLVSCIPPTVTSVYTLITRQLAGEESPDTMQFWAALVPLIAVAPFALTNWEWPTDPITWAFFVSIGFFGWLGHQLFTLAHRYAGASVLAPLTYVHIVYMSTASWLIFHQPPVIWTLIGTLIIVGSGLFIWLRERQVGAKTSAPPIR